MSKYQTFILGSALIALTSATVHVSACAQYIWLDEKGSKQFSDMPPPINTPKSRILKTPFKTAEDKSAATSVSENIDTSNTPKKLERPVTIATKNEDFQKRRTEQTETEKKVAEETQNKADKAKNCERAKSYQQTLDSGTRIATTDKNGERNYMDDGQRAKESADVKRAIADCK